MLSLGRGGGGNIYINVKNDLFSDLHTKNGTASGPTGDPITKVKLPNVGGHEGVGRIVALGPSGTSDLQIGQLLGIRFLSRICHRCSYCQAGVEQYCASATNHLHHEDGSFAQYCLLTADYVTPLPDDGEVDPAVLGPALCAGVTAYKAVSNTDIRPGEYLVVVGAGGGLGHFAVQYARARGARVIAVDSGPEKRHLLTTEYGVEAFVDYATSSSVVADVQERTDGIGAHAVVVTSGSAAAYAQAADMLRPGGALACCGIPPGKTYLQTPLQGVVIKGLRLSGNLVGSLRETLEAVELVRNGTVKPRVEVRPFRDLPQIYQRLEKGDVVGRVVVKIAED